MTSATLRTRKGKLTPFAFRCGYSETNPDTGLVVWWQDCCYFVAGWLNRESLAYGVHVHRACRTLSEARQIARFPYAPALPES